MRARRWMQAIAERFDLPKDLHPDELQAAAPPEAKNGAPETGTDAEAAQTMERALALPPAEAIQVLKTLFRDNPEVMDTLARAEALPPEEQARILQALFQAPPPSMEGMA